MSWRILSGGLSADRLERCNWNQTEAAEYFRIPLSTLNQKIKRLNIEVRKRNRESEALPPPSLFAQNLESRRLRVGPKVSLQAEKSHFPAFVSRKVFKTLDFKEPEMEKPGDGRAVLALKLILSSVSSG